MMNPADSVALENEWRNPTLRYEVIQKIEEAVEKFGRPINRSEIREMENRVYQKAKTKDEYLSSVATLTLDVREMSLYQKNQIINQPPQTVTPPLPTQNSANESQAMTQQDEIHQKMCLLLRLGNKMTNAPHHGYANGFLVDLTCRNDIMEQKIREAIRMCGMPLNTTPSEMKNHLQKANTEDEYLSSTDTMASSFKDMSMK